MDENHIKRHLVVDRYLQGTLSKGEAAEFEERLVWDRELIDELDLAERLRAGLREAIGGKGYAAAAGRVSIGDWLSTLFSVPQYAAAASFVLAATLTAGVLLSPFGAGRGRQEQGTQDRQTRSQGMHRRCSSWADRARPA